MCVLAYCIFHCKALTSQDGISPSCHLFAHVQTECISQFICKLCLAVTMKNAEGDCDITKSYFINRQQKGKFSIRRLLILM